MLCYSTLTLSSAYMLCYSTLTLSNAYMLCYSTLTLSSAYNFRSFCTYSRVIHTIAASHPCPRPVGTSALPPLPPPPPPSCQLHLRQLLLLLLCMLQPERGVCTCCAGCQCRGCPGSALNVPFGTLLHGAGSAAVPGPPTTGTLKKTAPTAAGSKSHAV